MYNLNRMEYLNTTFHRMQEIKEQVKERYKETDESRMWNILQDKRSRLFKMSMSFKKKKRLEDCSRHKELEQQTAISET